MKDFTDTLINSYLAEDAQLNLIFDEDVKEVQELCQKLFKNGVISQIPNEKITKMLIQMANIIQQEKGRIPYDNFVLLAKSKDPNIIDSFFSVAITRHMKRMGQVWIKIFPHMAKTKKPLEVRMGSGKGAPEDWVAVVKEGKIMFEVAGVPEDVAREALRLASHKLPIKTKIIGKGDELR